jgi:hypothetical protein
MKDRYLNKLFVIKGLLLVLFLISMFSCILKVKECPLPTCEIRKMHRHLLIFSDTPKDKKKPFSFLKKKAKTDSTSSFTDSTSITNDSNVVNNQDDEFSDHNSDAHKHKHEKTEHEASYIEVDGKVLDEEGNEYIDPKIQKKKDKEAKKKAKKEAKAQKKAEKKITRDLKKNKNDSTTVVLEPLDTKADEEEDNKYAGMTEEEYKHHRQHNTNLDTTHMHQYNEKELARQLKKEDKAKAKAQKKEDKLARKGKKGQSDHTRLYRSRITKWWKRDQNPKVGKYFKRQSDKEAPKKKLLERFKR